MEAKEKAKEVFNKMKGFRVKHSHSKKCALVCVNEIIEQTLNFEDEAYWNEVKQELEKINQLKQ